MSIEQKVISKPVSVIVVFAILVGLGVYLIGRIPINQFPEIEVTTVNVRVSYPGAGPEDVEKSVTRLLEGALISLNGLQTLSSTSSEGSSRVSLEFASGIDLAEATNDIRDALERVRNALPDEAGSPQIFKFNASDMPILMLAVRGNRTPEELREIAENRIQPKLEQVDGVALTSLRGGKERIVKVDVIQNRLDAYNLTLTQVSNSLASQNVQIAGGTFIEGNMRYLVRTSGEYTSLADIENTVVAYKGGTSSAAPKPVLLKDLAVVYEGFRDTGNIVYMDGKPGIYISVQKQSGTNSVAVADSVLKRVEELNTSGALPNGIDLFVVRNTTTMTRDSINQVTSSAYSGGVFVVIILFIFLRRLKSTLIVAISIPVSVLITIICMYFMGITLNISSLTGMALGIGMIVDNSIVIIENIFRYRERGAKLRTAALLGSKEMINAIVASTTTTICVFLPLLIFRNSLGRLGMLFYDTSFTVIFSIIASLLIAMLLVPVLASKFLPLVTKKQKQIRFRWLRSIDDAMENGFSAFDALYKRALNKVLDHKLITILIIVGLLLGSISFLPRLGLNLMPFTQDDSVSLSLKMPQGTPVETTLQVLQDMEAVVKREIRGIRNIILTAGGSGAFGGGETNQGSIMINLPPFEKRIDSSNDVRRKLRPYFNAFPGAVFSFGSGGFTMSLGGSSVSIVLKSDNLVKSKAMADQILSLIQKQVPEISDPALDLNEALPELRLVIDREKANSFGVDIATVGNELRANIEGRTATTYRTGGNEYSVLVILREEDRSALPDLGKIFVMSKTGNKVPLASFASFEKATGPVEIRRENQSRIIRVRGTLEPGSSASHVKTKLSALIDSTIIPDQEVIIDYAGAFQEVGQYSFELIKTILMAFLLVFGVMAIQFESFKDPFIIMFTIPLMAIGVIGIQVLTGQALSMFSLVGIVMLLGIVVNNGIVLVDYTNLMVKRGMSVRDACVEAAGNRLRPILMTSLTTILGLIPVAFFSGEGSDLWQPFGQTVIGGLTTSTLMTLFFIPVMYAVFNTNKARVPRRAEAARTAPVVQRGADHETA